jgi:hypothetical protein
MIYGEGGLFNQISHNYNYSPPTAEGGFGHPLAARGATTIQTSSSILIIILRIYLAP